MPPWPTTSGKCLMKWLKIVLNSTKNSSKKTSRKEYNKSNKKSSKKTNLFWPNHKKVFFLNSTRFSTKNTFPNPKNLKARNSTTNCNKSCQSQAKNGKTLKRNSKPNFIFIWTCFLVIEWNFLWTRTKKNCITWLLIELTKWRYCTILYKALNTHKKATNKNKN